MRHVRAGFHADRRRPVLCGVLVAAIAGAGVGAAARIYVGALATQVVDPRGSAVAPRLRIDLGPPLAGGPIAASAGGQQADGALGPGSAGAEPQLEAQPGPNRWADVAAEASERLICSAAAPGTGLEGPDSFADSRS